jgi:hypothetical protein
MIQRRSMIVIFLIFLFITSIAPVSLEAATQSDPQELDDDGPWLLFLATPEDETFPYLWGINADGSGLTQLSTQPVLNFVVNPYAQPSTGGHLVAYVGTSTENMRQDLSLYFLSLPDGGISDPIPLTSAETGFHPDDDDSAGVGADQKLQVATGLADTQGLVWSPDGRWLAFIGAMDGPSLDLYSYELATGTVRWLTDGPSHAYQLFWTQDSSQIIHSASICFACAGGHYESGQGIWGATPDGSALVTYEGAAAARFIVWKDASHLLMDSGPRNGEMGAARILDIANNQIDPVHLGAFGPIAYNDTGSHTVLYSYGNTELLTEGKGLYLVDIDSQEATFLMDMYADIWWDHYNQRFLFSGDLGFFSVTPDGMLTPFAATTSQVSSPDERSITWFDNMPREQWGGELWLQNGEGEFAKMLDFGGLDMEWSPDSQSFFYDIGQPGLYLVVAETMEVIPLFNEPGLLLEWPFSALGWQATWISE